MEFEQIVNRLEWLDEEHRKSKATVRALEERVESSDSNVDTLNKLVKELDNKLSEIGPVSARVNQFDEILSKQREDMNKALAELEKKHQHREREMVKRHQVELEEYGKNDAINTKDIDVLKEKAKELADENKRLSVTQSDIKLKMEEAIRKVTDIAQLHTALEENRRHEGRRVADLQGEISALRKRVDEFRQKSEVHGDSLRNIENRFSELIASETERKQGQQNFLDQQALAHTERERVYKEWREKIVSFKQQSENFESQTLSLDETLRAAKRAQETYLDLNQKLERRINEITEMQRLTEDRLRQEWVTFKADDQKRWTGYTLSQEESMRDLRKSMDKLEERLTAMDDMSQTLQDQLHQTTDTTEQQLQELMNLAHEWLSAYERIMGHTRKTAK
jgi:DNA repair exonuclease SbcCD ATPase subunit